MKIKLILLMLVLSVNLLLAQGEAALPFLAVQQSPILNGAGMLGAALPTNDIFGFSLNPAILGYTANQNHATLGYTSRKIEGIPWVDYKMNTYGINTGYDFGKKNKNLPLTLGFGYMYNSTEYHFSFGGDDKDSFHNLSFGAGLEYYLLFNVGVAAKFINSKLSDRVAGEEVNSASLNTTAFDLGAMIIAPISSLIFPKAVFSLGNENFIKPKVDFSFGYSLTNLGSEVYYIDAAQADPIPRTARLGYSFNLGADLDFQEKSYDLINYSFAAEVSDILIERDQNFKPEYQGTFGDISFGKNLIQLKGDDKNVVHKGHILNLFETVTIASGRFYGKGYENTKTNGWGISSGGLFKLLSNDNDNSPLNYILKHIIIEYYYALITFGEISEHKYNGFSLRYINFEL